MKALVILVLALPVLGRDLPAGAINVVEARSVVELCQESAFPAELLARDVPAGHRLRLLSEQTADPSAAAMLERHPDFAGYASGVFCFIEGEFSLAGVPLYAGGRGRMAFWWADVAETGPGQADPRYLGPSPRAQVAYIYDEQGVDRELALAAIPNARFGRVRMTRDGDAWTASVETAEGRVAARLMPTGARRPVEYATPAYITVPWIDAAHGEYFNVITYMGHHEQAADGEWTATGDALWARLFAGGPAARHRSMVQDGVSANLALYRRGQAAGR